MMSMRRILQAGIREQGLQAPPSGAAEVLLDKECDELRRTDASCQQMPQRKRRPADGNSPEVQKCCAVLKWVLIILDEDKR